MLGRPGREDDVRRPRLQARRPDAARAARGVGDDAFFEVLKGWVADHAGGSVTTEQFLAYAGEQTGQDVAALLSPWLYDAALPPFPG